MAWYFVKHRDNLTFTFIKEESDSYVSNFSPSESHFIVRFLHIHNQFKLPDRRIDHDIVH
jgi:hypothetical protein